MLFVSALVIGLQYDLTAANGSDKTKVSKKSANSSKKNLEAPKAEAEVIDVVRKDLEVATNEAAKKITECTIAKNRALLGLRTGKIDQVAYNALVSEKDKMIDTIKQGLLELAEAAVVVAEEVEEAKSYVSQFMTGAQNLAGKAARGALAPFKRGYGYSEQQKNLARAVIDELEELKKLEENKAIIAELDNEIYQQKLITGQEMGVKQKLLMGAVIAAAGVAGVVLAGKLMPSMSTIDVGQQNVAQGVSQISPAELSVNEQPRVSLIDAAKDRIKESQRLREARDPMEPKDMWLAAKQLPGRAYQKGTELLGSIKTSLRPSEDLNLDSEQGGDLSDDKTFSEDLSVDQVRQLRELAEPYVSSALTQDESTIPGSATFTPQQYKPATPLQLMNRGARSVGTRAQDVYGQVRQGASNLFDRVSSSFASQGSSAIQSQSLTPSETVSAEQAVVQVPAPVVDTIEPVVAVPAERVVPQAQLDAQAKMQAAVDAKKAWQARQPKNLQ